MKSNSLIFKTRLIGALSALLLIAFAAFLTIFAIFFDKRTEIRNVVSLQKEIQAKKQTTPTLLSRYQVKVIDSQSALQVTKEGTHILNDPLIREIFTLSGIAVYTYNNHYYYSIKNRNKTVWLKSNYTVTPYILYIFIASLILILLLLWLHIYIQSSLKPLKNFHEQIVDYGRSTKLTPLSFKNSDEISTLANAFYDSVKTLKDAQESRLTMIDTFMHEVKTTLTKLILRTHLLDQENPHKENLLENMNKMQEQLLEVKEYNAVMMEMLEFDYHHYYLNSLLDEVLYELDSTCTYEATSNLILKLDKELFSTALKSLLRNATKIDINAKSMSIEAKLKEDKKMHLDLFIAKIIFEKHGYNLKSIDTNEERKFQIFF